MAKRKSSKPQQSQAEEDKDVQDIYDRVRREFSAADLQKYTVIEKGIPAEKVLTDMVEIHRKIIEKKK